MYTGPSFTFTRASKIINLAAEGQRGPAKPRSAASAAAAGAGDATEWPACVTSGAVDVRLTSARHERRHAEQLSLVHTTRAMVLDHCSCGGSSGHATEYMQAMWTRTSTPPDAEIRLPSLPFTASHAQGTSARRCGAGSLLCCCGQCSARLSARSTCLAS